MDSESPEHESSPVLPSYGTREPQGRLGLRIRKRLSAMTPTGPLAIVALVCALSATPVLVLEILIDAPGGTAAVVLPLLLALLGFFLGVTVLRRKTSLSPRRQGLAITAIVLAGLSLLPVLNYVSSLVSESRSAMREGISMRLLAAEILLKQRDGILIPQENVEIRGLAAYGDSEETGLVVPKGFIVFLYTDPAFCVEMQSESGATTFLYGSPQPTEQGTEIQDGSCPRKGASLFTR